ncbi:MAG: Ig-like domain-containing protein [Dysgonamonadaceae bacterium]|jgi:uncharacterized protein (TIGR02145 family)|nr:Ig-like domain-containing protein [Dysgonamonadaceae bacterium]
MGTKNRSTKTAMGIFHCAAMAIIAPAIVSFASCGKKVTGVSLDKTVLSLIVGDIEQLTATVEPTGANKSVTWTSSDTGIATVDKDGKVTALAKGDAMITVTTNNGKKTATCAVTVEGVLINGIVWATRNVDAPGAFAASPESFGMFYQWNRKIGWSSTDPLENSNGGTTWDSSVPDGTTWESPNDPCPVGWRVPAQEELESLLNTDYEWITQNGVTGTVFGSAPNTIFLPAAGYRINDNGMMRIVGSDGFYWSSSQSNNIYVRTFDFQKGYASMYNDFRNFGFSIRCVKAE